MGGVVISSPDIECDPPAGLVSDDARLAGPLFTGNIPLLP